MIANRTGLLSVLLIGSLVSASPASPTCDPAIDLNAPGCAAALSVYERSRADEDRAKVPMRPDQAPSLFQLAPLTAAGIRFAKGASDPEVRAQRAVLTACHEFVDEQGHTHKASDHGRLTEGTDKRFIVASEEWLQHLIDRYGNQAIHELAEVILTRAEAHPRALAPFRLPPGLMLSR